MKDVKLLQQFMHNKGFEVLEEFGEGLEEPRSDKIYSSGNLGVKKDPGPGGTRNGDLLIPFLCRRNHY